MGRPAVGRAWLYPPSGSRSVLQKFDALMAKSNRCRMDTGTGHSRRTSRNCLIQIKPALEGKAKAIAISRSGTVSPVCATSETIGVFIPTILAHSTDEREAFE